MLTKKSSNAVRFQTAFVATYLAACILLASFQAPAAEIVQRDIAGGKMIVVSGNIDFGDDRRFASIAAQVRNGIVFFNSPGGSLDAAIQMGKIIRVMGLVTHVAEGDICVSACALAWLGGSARFMSPSAKIGFHAAYIDKLGEKEVSSVGNAIVGGYLNGLGFSENAIAYVTSAPPDGVRWLTLDDAAKVGIEVKRGLEPQTDRSSQPVQNVTNLECVIKQASSIDSGDPIQKITVQLFLDDKSNIEKLGVVHHAKSGAT